VAWWLQELKSVLRAFIHQTAHAGAGFCIGANKTVRQTDDVFLQHLMHSVKHGIRHGHKDKLLLCAIGEAKNDSARVVPFES
jgi:hypothetical protein